MKKSIMYNVTFEFKTYSVLAKTPEGAVKKVFRQLKRPIPPIDYDDGGWKGISVNPENGYKKVVNLYEPQPKLKQWTKI